MSKAVIIKGPHPDSKSYITLLPESLEALLDKAKDLFPIPPNHTSYLTLADDSSAIVLPDFLPLIREREVLIFSWSADTPRSSLRRSIGQAAPLAQIEPSSSVLRDSLECSNEQDRSSRGVRWDENVVSNEEKNKRVINRSRGSNKENNRDSATSRHRAEYVRQKIQEQEEIRQKEVDAAAARNNAITQQQQIGSENPFANPRRAEISTLNLTKEDLLVSGSSPPSYSSPRQREQSDEEHQTSSPLASPTRDVRGARNNNLGELWRMGLGSEKTLSGRDQFVAEEIVKTSEGSAEGANKQLQAASQEDIPLPEAVTPQENGMRQEENTISVDRLIEEEQGQSNEQTPGENSMNADANDLAEEEAVEQATSPIKTPEVKIKDVPAYQTMKSVVSQLRCHPSNQSFRQPCEEDFAEFCKERNRPVIDLFTISDSITLGKYGLEEPLKQFNQDLDQMWNNIRTFYAPQSQQTQSANVLETFSAILLQEWTRKSTIAPPRPIKSRPNASRLYNTPVSRREKHHKQALLQGGTSKSQQEAIFANLKAKAGIFPSSSPSAMNSKLGQSLKRPFIAAPKMQRPIKRAIVEVQSRSPVKEVEVSQDTSGIVTRGLAKRTAA